MTEAQDESGCDETGRVETIDVWFLEMLSRDQLRPPTRVPRADVRVAEVEAPSPAFVRFFYAAVGHDYHWVDRLSWSENDWRKWLGRPGMRLFVAYAGAAPAAFLLLEAAASGDSEVPYFGVLPEWIGQGIGGALLHAGVAAAWDAGAKRVWLHTCSLDSPAALPSYKARGFEVYYQGTREQRIIDRVGPW